MTDMYLGSQAPMYQNVRIRVFDEKTGRVRIERTAKNRVTKLMLWGIARFLAGEFNDSTPDKIYEFCPRYLALGSNKIPSDGETGGVTRAVTVNDARLLNEYTELNLNGQQEAVKRISIQSRQHKKLNTNFTEPFVKLSLSAYISSSKFNDLEIGEAGLFSKEYDNNCLARVVFPPFRKKEGEVIDVQWEITLLSYGNTKYPESVNIESHGGKIVIPLKYTSYHLITTSVGLYYNEEEKIIYDSFEDKRLFEVNANSITIITSIEDMKESQLAKYLVNINYPTLDDQTTPLETIYRQMTSYKLVDWQFYNANDDILVEPTPLYLGSKTKVPNKESLLADSENNLLWDSESNQLVTSDPVVGTTTAQDIRMTYVFNQQSEIVDKQIVGKLVKTSENNSYTVLDKTGNLTSYRVVSNLFYIKDTENRENWVVVGRDDENSNEGYYLYNGLIIKNTNNANEQALPTNYGYDGDLNIYTYSTKYTDNSTGYYLVYGNKNSLNDIFKIYSTKNGIFYDSGYWIDWDADKETYNKSDDTGYHVTNDNYFAIGNSEKMKVTITPSDATDRSLNWSISNSNIAKLDQNGVLESWNLGEALAFVSTTNGIKGRVVVEVVREASFIPVESITVTPEEITFYVNSPEAQSAIITAIIDPPFATYNTVSWSFDNSASKLLIVQSDGGPIVLPGNRAQIDMNADGNIGRGKVTATTQGGISGSCIVNVTYVSSDKEDCPDPYHDLQQI